MCSTNTCYSCRTWRWAPKWLRLGLPRALQHPLYALQDGAKVGSPAAVAVHAGLRQRLQGHAWGLLCEKGFPYASTWKGRWQDSAQQPLSQASTCPARPNSPGRWVAHRRPAPGYGPAWPQRARPGAGAAHSAHACGTRAPTAAPCRQQQWRVHVLEACHPAEWRGGQRSTHLYFYKQTPCRTLALLRTLTRSSRRRSPCSQCR